MSIGLYDIAVSDKIKSWILDPNMTVLYPDETHRLFSQVIDQNVQDKPLQLPLIAISRDRDIELTIPAKRPMSYRGKTFNATDKVADHLNAIPLKIKYQIDIYTRYRKEADEYLRNFVYQILTYPTVTIQIPYRDCDLKQDSFMTLEPLLSDNSDIPERLIPGQFTRETIRFRLDDANFYAYTTDQIPKIVETGIYVDEQLEDKAHKISDDCAKDTTIKI